METEKEKILAILKEVEDVVFIDHDGTTVKLVYKRDRLYARTPLGLAMKPIDDVKSITFDHVIPAWVVTWKV